MFEAARLQSYMVFGLDNKLIPVIESEMLGVAPKHPSFIALNANTRKQKQNNSSNRKSIDTATDYQKNNNNSSSNIDLYTP